MKKEEMLKDFFKAKTLWEKKIDYLLKLLNEFYKENKIQFRFVW